MMIYYIIMILYIAYIINTVASAAVFICGKYYLKCESEYSNNIDKAKRYIHQRLLENKVSNKIALDTNPYIMIAKQKYIDAKKSLKYKIGKICILHEEFVTLINQIIDKIIVISILIVSIYIIGKGN